MRCKTFVSLATWCLLLTLIDAGSIYPSIVWDPWNPLFSCGDPQINVRIGDTVNLVCPSDEIKFFVPTSSVKLPYENMYFLGSSEEHYQRCNATGMKRLLNCNGLDPKHLTVTFRDFALSPNSLVFEETKSYYFIGTGFRSKENLENTVNGSCMMTNEEGLYRLRLRINVCAADDTECRICKSVACYYKHCEEKNANCTPWYADGDTVYRNVSACFKIVSRSCFDGLIGDHFTETNHISVPCCTNTTCSNASASSAKLRVDPRTLSGDDVMVNMLALAVVLAFILGVVLGAIAHRCLDVYKRVLKVDGRQKGKINEVLPVRSTSFSNAGFVSGSNETSPHQGCIEF